MTYQKKYLKKINTNLFIHINEMRNKYKTHYNNNEYSLNDESDNIIIAPYYENLFSIYNNHLWALEKENWHIISSKNQKIFSFGNGIVGYFYEGVSKVCINNKFGYINYKGKWICEPQFDDAYQFHRNVGFVKKENFWAMLSFSEKSLSEFNIQHFFNFSKKSIFVVKNNIGYIIDNKGNTLEKLEYNGIEIFEHNNKKYFKIENNNKFGIANSKFRILCPFNFLDISISSENLIAAKNIKGKYGYINFSGKTIIPFLFDFATPFENGIAIVIIDDKYGAINLKGEIVIPIGYDLLKYTSYSNIRAELEDYFFYFDFTGLLIPELEINHL